MLTPLMVKTPMRGMRNVEPSISADVARADDEAAGRLADQLAQAERAEGVREDLGVAVGAVVDEQHQRLGPLAVVGVEDQALAAVALRKKVCSLPPR